MTRGDAGNAMNGLGEVIPTDDTLIAEMIHSGDNTLVDGSHNGCSKVAGIGRGAYLVENNPQFLLLVAQTNHRLHEVISEGAV